MEDLFNIIATNYSDSLDGLLTPDMMDDSVARANDFFDLGGHLGLGADTPTPLSFEGVDFFVEDSCHFEDQVFNPNSFIELGFTGQDALDLLITHEGTSTILHDMDVHFDGFQEELCSDYMTGVRAGLAGMEVSQIEYALADIPQELGHADGDFRAEAFSEGVAFANEFMETHGQPPTFNDCLEEYNNGHMHDLADLAQLEDQLYIQECEIDHYHGLLESQPDNKWARQQLQESEAQYQEIRTELENKNVAFTGNGHNHYDDNTIIFVEKMKENSVEIPRSVDHTYNDNNTVTMDRHSAGGMTGIDKSLCRSSIERALNDGNITKDVYDDLIRALSKC